MSKRSPLMSTRLRLCYSKPCMPNAPRSDPRSKLRMTADEKLRRINREKPRLGKAITDLIDATFARLSHDD